MKARQCYWIYFVNQQYTCTIALGIKSIQAVTSGSVIIIVRFCAFLWYLYFTFLVLSVAYNNKTVVHFLGILCSGMYNCSEVLVDSYLGALLLQDSVPEDQVRIKCPLDPRQ